jgi:CMP-N-acetylneuraminic acid synthetase
MNKSIMMMGRINSTRLPGKLLMKLDGQTLWEKAVRNAMDAHCRLIIYSPDVYLREMAIDIVSRDCPHSLPIVISEPRFLVDPIKKPVQDWRTADIRQAIVKRYSQAACELWAVYNPTSPFITGQDIDMAMDSIDHEPGWDGFMVGHWQQEYTIGEHDYRRTGEELYATCNFSFPPQPSATLERLFIWSTGLTGFVVDESRGLGPNTANPFKMKLLEVPRYKCIDINERADYDLAYLISAGLAAGR